MACVRLCVGAATLGQLITYLYIYIYIKYVAVRLIRESCFRICNCLITHTSAGRAYAAIYAATQNMPHTAARTGYSNSIAGTHQC